jgi:hypothetical protein
MIRQTSEASGTNHPGVPRSPLDGLLVAGPEQNDVSRAQSQHFFPIHSGKSEDAIYTI